MKYLSKLSPAETLFLLHGEKTSWRDLLKYTFLDLLLNQRLAIQEQSIQSSAAEPVRYVKYIIAGNQFPNYASRDHEDVFLSIFTKSPEAALLFKNLIKVAYQNAINQMLYQGRVRNSTALRTLFSRSVWQKVFGGFTLTPEGKVIQEAVRSELARAEEILSDVATNKKEGIEFLKSIGGNLFLLKNFDFQITKEIDQALVAEVDQTTYDGFMGGYWFDFSSDTHWADTGCSSDGDSSGCGGDSGCSGCGGCGGD